MFIFPIFCLMWINGIMVTSYFSLISDMINRDDQTVKIILVDKIDPDSKVEQLPVAIHNSAGYVDKYQLQSL